MADQATLTSRRTPTIDEYTFTDSSGSSLKGQHSPHVNVNDRNSLWTWGDPAKQLRSLLSMISGDDFLNDNDSSNGSVVVTKGLESLIKEQSQSTLGILFFPLPPVSLRSDLLIIKASKKCQLHLNEAVLLDFKMWIKIHLKLGPISITKRPKIRVTFPCLGSSPSPVYGGELNASFVFASFFLDLSQRWHYK